MCCQYGSIRSWSTFLEAPSIGQLQDSSSLQAPQAPLVCRFRRLFENLFLAGQTELLGQLIA